MRRVGPPLVGFHGEEREAAGLLRAGERVGLDGLAGKVARLGID